MTGINEFTFRLELLPLSRNNKPELIFMDQIEEVAADVPYKNESSIQIKLKDNIQRIILYNQVSISDLVNSLVSYLKTFFQDQIAQKEWIQSIRNAHKTSQELLGSITNKKVGKIYGTEDSSNKTANISPPTGAIPAKNTNGSN